MTVRTGRWSKLSVEHKFRYTGNERLLVITMSKTSGVAEGLYGLVVGGPVQISDNSFRRHNYVGVSPVSCSAEYLNPRVLR